MTLKHHTSVFLYTLHILATTVQSWLIVNLLLGNRKITEIYLEIHPLLTICVDVFAFVCTNAQTWVCVAKRLCGMWFYFIACFQGIQ